MADRSSEIRTALSAIKEFSSSDLIITRAVIVEIERLVGTINTLTDDELLKREGEALVSRALGRYPDRPAGDTPSPIVSAARFHGAVARYEFVLRQAGFLSAADGDLPQH